MRHLEASKKIVTTETVDAASVKYGLVQRLRGAFHVETVGEGIESFSITAVGKTGSYAFTLGVSIKSDPRRIRILIDGQNNLRMATKVFYVLSLLAIFILNMFSDSIDLAGTQGVAMNAMFFLVIGGFIIYDHDKKMDEPQIILDRILDTVEAEFG